MGGREDYYSSLSLFFLSSSYNDMKTLMLIILLVLLIIALIYYLNPSFDTIIVDNKRRKIIWYNTPRGRTWSIIW